MAKSARSWRVLLVLVIAFVLGACGARVDTLLVINDDGSGSREMQLTLDRDDFESYVSGSEEDLVAAIESALPPQLRMTDIESTEDHIRGTLILDFEDPDDYKAKVSELLGDDETDMSLLAEQGLFLSGVELSEDFMSANLLEWIPQALVEADLIDEGDVDDVFDTEPQGTIEYLGNEESQHLPFSVEDSEKSGFSKVALITTIESLESIERIVRYELPVDVYEANSADFNAFLEDAKPSGASLAPASSDRYVDEDTGEEIRAWDITFTGNNPADIAEKTRQALDDPEAEFQIEQDLDSADSEITVVSRVDCDKICAEDKGEVFELLTYPSGWEPTYETSTNAHENTTDNRHLDGEFTFKQRINIVAVDLITKIWPDESIHTVLTIEVEDHPGLESFAAQLTPEDGVGSLETKATGDNTTFRIDLGKRERWEYASNMESYFGGANVYVAEERAGFYSTDTAFIIKLDFDYLLGSLFEVDEITHSFQPQAGFKPISDSGESTRAEGTWLATSIGVKTTNVSGWVITAFLIALVAAAFVGALVFRERIAAWWRNFSAKQKAAREQHQAIAQQQAAAAPTPQSASQPAGNMAAQTAPAPSIISGTEQTPAAESNTPHSAGELELLFSYGLEVPDQPA